MAKKTRKLKRLRDACLMTTEEVSQYLGKTVEDLVIDRKNGTSRPIKGSDRICGVDTNGFMWSNIGRDPNIIRYNGIMTKIFQNGELISTTMMPRYADEE